MTNGIPQKLSAPYPMVRVINRELGPFYDGPVFIWDVDKTYLDTRFSQLKNLVKIPFEFGVDKRAIPGTVELLKGLRDGPGGSEYRPLFFVSASPPQIRRSVEKKMLLDGVDFDGITYKNPGAVLLRLQFDQLKEQVAFKLSALLLLVAELPTGARLHLFGDNAEKDQDIYGLFARVVSGDCAGEELHGILLGHGVRKQYANNVVSLALTVEKRRCVDGIYIHNVRGIKVAENVVENVPLLWDTAPQLAQELLTAGLLSKHWLQQVESATGQLPE